MFDIKILDIFSTFCVGLLTLTLSVLIYFLFVKLFVKDRLDDDIFLKYARDLFAKNYGETWYAIFITVLIYSVGMIAGDLTDRMTDTDDSKKGALAILRYITGMESESSMRKEALINPETDSLTGLGRSIFLTPEVVKAGNMLAGTTFFVWPRPDSSLGKDTGNQTNRERIREKPFNMDSVWTILHSELQKDPVTNADFTRFVLQIYYVSKNWVYSKDGEPLHELKDLQNRIDMSRSLVLICVVGEIIILVMWILFLLFYAYLRLVKGSSIRFHWLNINAVTVIVGWSSAGPVTILKSATI
jgi:hypothetical protein